MFTNKEDHCLSPAPKKFDFWL